MRALLLVTVVATACGSGHKAAGLVGTRPPAAAPAVDERGLTTDLTATVLESYRAVSGGWADAYVDGLERDPRLVLLDVGADGVTVGWNPGIRHLTELFPGRERELVSKALEVHVSRDLTVGWTFDELSYRVAYGRRKAAVPLRLTAVYERRDGRWSKVLEHASYAVPDQEAFAWAADGRAASPARLVDDTPAGAAAGEVRQLLLGMLGDAGEDARRHASVEADALVVGSDPVREVRGAAVAELPTVRALYGYDCTVLPGDLRVRVSRSGTVAWAAANVLVHAPRGGKNVTLPLRATWVLERREPAWRVVQTHVSVPVPANELERRALGDEG